MRVAGIGGGGCCCWRPMAGIRVAGRLGDRRGEGGEVVKGVGERKLGWWRLGWGVLRAGQLGQQQLFQGSIRINGKFLHRDRLRAHQGDCGIPASAQAS